VEYLGYIVAVDGVTISERKVESMKKVEVTTVSKGSTDFYWFCEFLPRVYQRLLKNLQADYRNIKRKSKRFQLGNGAGSSV